jgi:hypothetical protein
MRQIFFIAIALSCLQALQAQQPEYKVVFDMTSRDSVNQQSLIRQLTFIREANPKARLEVVIYGQGLPLVTSGSGQQAAVIRLIADKAASFKVCAATMKRHNVGREQLIAGVEVVPDGIYEIITRQQEGWGYIKVAN